MRNTKVVFMAFCLSLSHDFAQAQSSSGISFSAGWITRTMSATKTGRLVELSACEGFSRYLVYSLSIGYHEWETANETTSERLFDIPIHGGVRWEVIDGTVTPYLSMEIGLHILRHVVEWTSVVVPAPSWARTFDGQRRSRQDNAGRLGARVGVGIGFDLVERVQMDVGSHFVYVPYGFVGTGEKPETTAAIGHADAVIGIRYQF